MKNVDIMSEFQKITGEVVGRIFFGRNLNKYQLNGQPLTTVAAELLTELMSSSLNKARIFLGTTIYNMTPTMIRVNAKIVQFRAICNEIINDRRKSLKTNPEQITNKIAGEKDLLDLFLEQQQNNTEDAIPDEEIIDEFVSFFLAGMDTTGHLVTMIVYNLCTHPEYLNEAIKEVEHLYKGKNEKQLSVEDLNSMEFMNLIIKETLRFNTPVTRLLFRTSMEDHNIGEISIKKGTDVTVVMANNNHNPKYFDEPEKMDPYRWSEGRLKSLHPFAYTPFSAGPRNCIGQHLSTIEVKIILGELLSRYEIKISEGYEHKMTMRFLNETENPLMVDLRKRSG